MRIWAALSKMRTCPASLLYLFSLMITPRFKCHLDPNDFHIYIFSSLSWNPDSYPTAHSTPLLGCPIDISSLTCSKILIPFPTHKYASSQSSPSLLMGLSSLQLLKLKVLQSSLIPFFPSYHKSDLSRNLLPLPSKYTQAFLTTPSTLAWDYDRHCWVTWIVANYLPTLALAPLQSLTN